MTSGFRLQTPSRMPMPPRHREIKLQSSNYKIQPKHKEQNLHFVIFPTVYCLLSMVHGSPLTLTVHCPRSTFYFLLFTSYFLLLTFYFSLLTSYFSLLTSHCSLPHVLTLLRGEGFRPQTAGWKNPKSRIPNLEDPPRLRLAAGARATAGFTPPALQPTKRRRGGLCSALA